MYFVANFIRFPAVQKFSKLVKISESYRQLKGRNFFETQYMLMLLRLACMPNVMAALPNIGGTNEERKFRNSRRCPTPINFG